MIGLFREKYSKFLEKLGNCRIMIKEDNGVKLIYSVNQSYKKQVLCLISCLLIPDVVELLFINDFKMTYRQRWIYWSLNLNKYMFQLK